MQLLAECVLGINLRGLLTILAFDVASGACPPSLEVAFDCLWPGSDWGRQDQHPEC